MNTQDYRINIYQILSEALKEPQEEFGEEQQDIVDFLQSAFEALQYPIDSENYQLWPNLAKDINGLRNDYRLSFLYPAVKRVLPIESIYRQWTLDETAEVPFAKEKGHLMSDFALHMQALYDQYQLSIPQEYSSMPDHLCLELEFFAFLLENESIELQKVFMNEHLNWVDELYQDAVKQDIPLFYRQVIQVTAEFLKYELDKNLRS
ncbi:molecular chaperone [Pelosinus sp. sgz500959]|uniref:TorD/DmsD family molecular chaperone n=1 Tax=Pelosinus sp. sgz500959 TaxID=3242472 RepID=UPI0036722E65